jgi:hypothetical protein
MLKILSVSAALSFLFVSGAMAQSGGAGACVADIADLSDVCKARMAELAAARTTCRADVEKQCGTKTRRTQKVACVKDAVTNLGDECKAAIAAVVTREK